MEMACFIVGRDETRVRFSDRCPRNEDAKFVTAVDFN